MGSIDESLQDIPGPVGLPFLGNALNVDPNATLQSFIKLGREYDPVYKLSLGNDKVVFVNTRELVDEVCDETRFKKIVSVSIGKMRQFMADGLFTAHHGEHNWGVAHRILMPVFGPMKIREMFPEMKDVAQQLCLKWARYGDSVSIPVTDDFTRLTLDTIALCAMDYRFNSFYRDGGLHPFVQSMGNALAECGVQSQRPDVVNALRWQAQKDLLHDTEIMRTTSQEIMRRRRERPVDTPDLLNALLNGRDPKTGEGMTDDSIINNMITFLIAGHETTSGMLSFAFYYLLKQPGRLSLKKAREEVDNVVGTDAVEVEHLAKLPFINAILRETLRLQPTAPIFSVTPFKDEVIGGKYLVKEGDSIFCVLHNAHRDKAVFGDDADEFKPERMLDENFKQLPSNSWKPFGNGMRACIGRAFAWQEALLVMVLLLQNFEFEMADPSYELQVKETLTIKPDGFEIFASLRRHHSPTELLSALSGSGSAATNNHANGKATSNQANDDTPKKPMTILYGSNSGSCEALARRLAGDAAAKGFSAKTVAALDAATENLPKDQPVIIITASYDGQPAENAGKFVSWLESLKEAQLKDVLYAVFGCGHRDWTTTLYRIPKLIDERLDAVGAKRLTQIGFADSADIRVLAAATTHEKTKAALEELATTRFKEDIRDKRVSVLDLLEKYLAIALPFGAFLNMLPPLRLRTYSISSAPSWKPSHASLTISVISQPALSGSGQYSGVASNYLADLSIGDRVYVSPRVTKDAFHLPADMSKTPIVMVAAGSGIAPFMGFVQQRAGEIRSGASLAPATLFFGCHDPEADDLYRKELDEFEAEGAVRVHRAYSRKSAGFKTPDLKKLWAAGAKFYVCGSPKMSSEIKRIVAKIAFEVAEGPKPMSEDDLQQWFRPFETERFVAEVFA
ncbi:putative cytochrome p450 protein [Neofusicoccum parvum UCRNP2]|uniref:Putative cytochrome p450 protein n=1 Tax=Botryosphaeria parva (strain UCR-NP2) TaxID=1287680 RepID=R1E9I8_BOTPV|nr:putative cytochrome p450 protein [Neofusicoccum parvum UCRNP2]